MDESPSQKKDEEIIVEPKGIRFRSNTDLIREGLLLFFRASDHEVGNVFTQLKKDIYRRVFQKFFKSPEGIQPKIKEVNEAFIQLSKVKKILEIHGDFSNIGETQFNEGKKHFRNKDYEKALVCFEEAVIEAEGKIEVFICAGTAALYSHKYEKANFYADKVLASNSNDVQGLVLKAMILREFHRLKEALQLLERAHQLKPNSPIIEKYLQRARDDVKAKASLISSAAKDLQYAFKRKWRRARLEREIQINDVADSSSKSLKTASLSAGGCLVEGADLPEEFHFTLALNAKKQVWGVGKKIYDIQNKMTGIRFQRLSAEDEHLINLEVMLASH